MTLNELVKRKGLTTEQLAKKIGVSIMTISYWNRGLKQPTTANIIKLAETLDVTPMTIFKIFLASSYTKSTGGN